MKGKELRKSFMKNWFCKVFMKKIFLLRCELLREVSWWVSGSYQLTIVMSNLIDSSSSTSSTIHLQRKISTDIYIYIYILYTISNY